MPEVHVLLFALFVLYLLLVVVVEELARLLELLRRGLVVMANEQLERLDQVGEYHLGLLVYGSYDESHGLLHHVVGHAHRVRHLAACVSFVFALSGAHIVSARVLVPLVTAAAVAKVIVINDILNRIFLALLIQVLLE